MRLFHSLIVLSILFFSCSKNEEDPIKVPNLVCTGIGGNDYFPLQTGITKIYENGIRHDIASRSLKDSNIYFSFSITDLNKLRNNIGWSYYRIGQNGDVYRFLKSTSNGSS